MAVEILDMISSNYARLQQYTADEGFLGLVIC